MIKLQPEFHRVKLLDNHDAKNAKPAGKIDKCLGTQNFSSISLATSLEILSTLWGSLNEGNDVVKLPKRSSLAPESELCFND